MKKMLLTAALLGTMLAGCTQKSGNSNDNHNDNHNDKEMKTALELTQEWDKVFPLSDKVAHRKVTFQTQYGLTLAADLYMPKTEAPLSSPEGDTIASPKASGNASLPLPAIAVSGPFGAVKEQCSGLYAMKMAERGFVALAFDPSYTGESSGEPRRTASPESA